MKEPQLFYCGIDGLRCSDNEESAWSIYLRTLSGEDAKRVEEFLFTEDKKRALISILLQKAATREFLGLPNDHGYTIERTKVRFVMIPRHN
jgi:hypothetical protein